MELKDGKIEMLGMNFMNLKKLEEKKRNIDERRKFVKFWANYIREHLDKEWSEQQKKLLDLQLRKNR